MKKNILLTAAALVTTLAGVAQWQPAGDRIRTPVSYTHLTLPTTNTV